MFVFSNTDGLVAYIASLKDRIGDRPIVIFGSGVSAYNIHAALIINRMSPCFFVDNNNAIIGTEWLKIPVKHPSALHATQNAVVIISSIPHARSMVQQAEKLGMVEEENLFLGYPEEIFLEGTGPAEYAINQKNWSEAAKLWIDLCQQNPDEPSGYIFSAYALMQNNDFETAEKMLDKVMVLSPYNAMGLQVCAEVLLRRQHIDKAIEVWSVLSKNPNCKNMPGFYQLTSKLLTHELLSKTSRPDNLDRLTNALLTEPGSDQADFVPTLVWLTFELKDHYKSAFKKLRNVIQKQLFEWDGEGSYYFSAELTALCLQIEGSGSTANYEMLLDRYVANSSMRRLCYIFNLSNKYNSWLKNYAIQILPDGRLSEISPEQLYNLIILVGIVDHSLCDRLLKWVVECYGLRQRRAVGPLLTLSLMHKSRCVRHNERKFIAPAITQKASPPRLKIALCISGQLRGYKDALQTWQNLHFSDHHVDTFVHVWQSVGRKYPVPMHAERVFSGAFLKTYRKTAWQIGLPALEKRYPSLFNYFTLDDKVSVDELRDFYGTDHIEVEDDKATPFSSYNNSQKMHYKIQACFQLVEQNGTNYDLVVRIRPDLFLMNSEPVDWDKIYNRTLRESAIFADSGMKFFWFGYGIGDLFAVGSFDLMSIYSHTFDFTERLKSEPLYGLLTEYWGHLNLAQASLLNGVRVNTLPKVKFGGVRDEGMISPVELKRLILSDIGELPRDEIDIALIDALEWDIANG